MSLLDALGAHRRSTSFQFATAAAAAVAPPGVDHGDAAGGSGARAPLTSSSADNAPAWLTRLAAERREAARAQERDYYRLHARAPPRDPRQGDVNALTVSLIVDMREVGRVARGGAARLRRRAAGCERASANSLTPTPLPRPPPPWNDDGDAHEK